MIPWRACLLTMGLETAFFALTGPRDRLFLCLCLAVNAASNLTLNLLLGLWGFRILTALILELGVLAAEYIAYALVKGPSARLFLLTLSANILSFSLGWLLFGLP